MVVSIKNGIIMNSIQRISILLAFGAVAFVGCKEDTLKTYSGENYVHFKPDANDVVAAEYNFATGETTRETEYSIPVDVRLWGFLPEDDFSFTTEIVADGTTAVPADYVLHPQQTFKAGEAEGKFHITVRRREKLLETDYKIVVRMVSADGGHVVAPSAYTTVTISVKDDLSSLKPQWWATTKALGSYSDIKFRVFNIYLGRFLKNLNGYTDITFKEEALKFKAWWKQQWDEGNYRYYDTDVTTPLYDTIPD